MASNRNMPIRRFILVGSLLCVTAAVHAQTTLYVDVDNCGDLETGTQASPYCLIQSGIDAAAPQDEVVVAPGEYYEVIDLFGKAITLRSSDGPETTLIGSGELFEDTIVLCVSGEGPDTILDGFTISGGNGDMGGGMRNIGASPTVRNCVFSNNQAQAGGGMYNAAGIDAAGSNPTVTNCRFFGNTADAGGGMLNLGQSSPAVTNCSFVANTANLTGGGMRNDGDSNPTVTNCVFVANRGSSGGGGMYNDGASNPTVTNCTFTANDADDGALEGFFGGAIANDAGSNSTVTNCILWDNNPDEIGNAQDAAATVTYSDVQGGFPGTGNVDTDPLFVDADGPSNFFGEDDNNLRVRLSCGAAVIDAGNNLAFPIDITTDDLDGNPRFFDTVLPDNGNGTAPIVDMGAYENLGTPGIIYVDADAMGTADGASWENAYPNLRLALDRPPAWGSEIWVAEGTYMPDGGTRLLGGPIFPGSLDPAETFHLVNGVAILGGFKGDEILCDERDPNPASNRTVLSGDLDGDDIPNELDCIMAGDNSSNVVTGDASDETAVLDGFTVTRGDSFLKHGGGIRIEFGSPTISNCRITLNEGVDGGGIFLSHSEARFTNCSITRNFADNGAGLFAHNGVSPVFASCAITDNDSMLDGGGIYLGSEGILLVTNCTIAGNFAAKVVGGGGGGGIFAVAGSTLIIENSIIWGNVGCDETFNGCPTVCVAPAAANQIQIAAEGFIAVSFSDIQDDDPDDTLIPFGTPFNGNIDDDPMFLDALDPEGPDYRLKTGSPAIDAGSNFLIPPGVVTDLDREPRRLDDPETTDCFQFESEQRILCGEPPVVDMGAHEYSPLCPGTVLEPPEDIAGFTIEYLEMNSRNEDLDPNNDTVVPLLGALFHPKVPLKEDDGANPVPRFIAADPGEDVTITWLYTETEGDDVQEREKTYFIGECAVDTSNPYPYKYEGAGVKYFKSYPSGAVELAELHHPTVIYNSTILRNENPVNPNDPGPAIPPHVRILGTQFHVDPDSPVGFVLIRYEEHPLGALTGFELVEITADTAENAGLKLIGRDIIDSGEEAGQNFCQAVLVKNIEDAGGVPVAFQRRTNSPDIYPIRPETDPNKFIVILYKPTPLENCWPDSVRRHTTDWPPDPQLMVIDQKAEVGMTPAGSLVDLRSDLYCGREVMYQEAFEPAEELPFAHITPAGEFGARNPGRSVLRLDQKPDEASQCGDAVFFEVVYSYDHLGALPSQPSLACGDSVCGTREDGTVEDRTNCLEDCGNRPAFAEALSWPIGSQIDGMYCRSDDDSDGKACGDVPVCTGTSVCADKICEGDIQKDGRLCTNKTDCGVGSCTRLIQDPDGPTFPHGYLFIDQEHQTSPPYNVQIFEDTGQIFPVNLSTPHGSLEVWWSQEGAFAPGIHWPFRVVTYDTHWPTANDARDPNDDPIVIAARTGAGQHSADATVYDVGEFAEGSNELPAPQVSVPGYQPNDEHASLLPGGENDTLVAFAVRNDNPWMVRPDTHGYVLIQEPPSGEGGLWQMSVHKVVAEEFPDDFQYLLDECDICVIGTQLGAACTKDSDCAGEGGKCNPCVVAGEPIDPLFPVNHGAAACVDDDPDDGQTRETYLLPRSPPLDPADPTDPAAALWVDSKKGVWAIAGPDEGNTPRFSDVYIWENWTDRGCQPWLVNGVDCCSTTTPPCPDPSVCTTGEPWPVRYEPNWPKFDGDGCTFPDDPKCAQLVSIGETVNRDGQCGSIEILHNDANVRITDPTLTVSIVYTDFPPEINFAKLPPHLFSGKVGGGPAIPDRVSFDAGEHKLSFRGVMSQRDQDFLVALGDSITDGAKKTTYGKKIGQLSKLSRVPVTGPADHQVCDGGTDSEPGLNTGVTCTLDSQCQGEDARCIDLTPTVNKSVSFAHHTAEVGWVTLGLQNDEPCAGAGLPISVEVMRVECPPFDGRINVIEPQCPLVEKLTLQFSGDGGGDLPNLYFQWQYNLDFDPLADTIGWVDYAAPTGYGDGAGLREVLIEGASEFTLEDTHWRVRYRGYPGCPCDPGTPPNCNEVNDQWPGHLGGDHKISKWTKVQLAEGWVKRVVRGLNPYDQRIQDFHVNPAVTYVDMIRQAGKRFEDNVALNCAADNINNVGLIELYSTVLGRARLFSIDNDTIPVIDRGVRLALQLAAGKISDLYMLLANEAFADAEDPTVGVFADQGDASGIADPNAMFSFENQVASLLAEELALLRGLDRVRPVDKDPIETDLTVATVYNRLVWNFTSDKGQVAYANNYQLTDVEEAQITYPQGHGDAWGHYLTAMKQFYDLLQTPKFDWVVKSEDVLVEGQIVPVGYMYERKFAHAAASKARTGSAITSQTFRELYTPATLQQRLGYPDRRSSQRAWGLTDWGQRAGQGAYLDWAMANALLPADTGKRCSTSPFEACLSDDNCPEACVRVAAAGMRCSNTHDECSSDNDCAQLCVQPTFCTTSHGRCATDDDCNSGESCVASFSCTVSRTGCANNGECPLTGESCEDNKFCTADGSACSADEDCSTGTCLDFSDTIRQIDRSTVAELGEIPASYSEIQAVLDQADAGLNPLGLAADVVAFGLDPKGIDDGKTHFDQVYKRAVDALHNAVIAFDFANDDTQRLRSMQDNEERFDQLVEERELDFNSRLIEVFGSPFVEDVGFGGSYPAGYTGADFLHFDYVDPSNIIAQDDSSNTTTIKAVFDSLDFSLLAGNDNVQSELEQEAGPVTLEFNVSTDGLGLLKPAHWGARPSPGEIQFARSQLLQTVGRYLQALESYESLLDQIEEQASALKSRFDLDDNVLGVMRAGVERQTSLNALIHSARLQQLAFRKDAAITVLVANAGAEFIPTNLIAGLADGGDFGAVARGAIKLAANIVAETLTLLADAQSLVELARQQDKEIASLNQQITITGIDDRHSELQLVASLKLVIGGLPTARLQIYTLQESMAEATGRYHAAHSKGVRLLEQLVTFRGRTEDRIRKFRYRDMAFRVFRNDALQKYRAQYDLSARYVYLAAKAYDYETNLLATDDLAGQRFLTGIVKERGLGTFDVDKRVPHVGRGLSGQLAGLSANFEVLRSELGFNSRDQFQRTFSLRWELYRIDNSISSDGAWQACLASGVCPSPTDNGVPMLIPDLNEWDIYRHFCQPLRSDEDPAVRVVEPALVIPFSTELISGHNLFGKDSQGDETLPPDRFAIKIQSVGISFAQSYASPPLNKQVNVYFIPTGLDMMRVPTDGSLRTWHVLDQTLPVPFPLSEAELREPDWRPWDALTAGSSAVGHRRRFPTLAACPTGQVQCDQSHKLSGRSLWNSQWYLIIPLSQLLSDDTVPAPTSCALTEPALCFFIEGENGTGVRDIKLTIKANGYTGTSQD